MAIATINQEKTTSASVVGKGCHFCASRHVCQATRLTQDLPEGTHTELFHPRVIKAGKHLFHSGDALTTLYVIKSGAFKTYLNNESGDEHIVSFHMSGEALGADGLGDYKHQLSVVALENSTVCAAPIKKLESEVKRFSSNWLIKQACQESLRNSQMFLVNIRNNTNSYARLAFFLIKQSRDHKLRGFSEREFRLEMKRGDIANYLGLTIETVSRVLHNLQENLVLVVDGRYITINNFEKLHAIAEMRSLTEKLTA